MLDPFGRPVRLPAVDLSREDKVGLLLEFFEACFEGRTPSRRSALFAAGSALSYFREGGKLEKDFWGIAPRRGDTRTPKVLAEKVIAARLDRDPRQDGDGG